MKIEKTFLAALVLAAPLFLAGCGDGDDWHDDYGPGWRDDTRPDDRGDNQDGYTALDIAQVLAGEWEGPVTLVDGTGTYSFNANMTFAQNKANAVKGTGTEYDYVTDNDGNVTDEQLLKFNWQIDQQTGDIYIQYLGGGTYMLDIDAKTQGYYLSEDEGLFNGYMLGYGNSQGSIIRFDFKRVTAEAKGATRAASAKSFGVPTKTAVAKGTAALPARR